LTDARTDGNPTVPTAFERTRPEIGETDDPGGFL
jgi:hypothetical protein